MTDVPESTVTEVDVAVVGAGNAGLAAALAAAETGASVVVLEAAPKERYGSDSYFSGGLFRVSYEGFEDLEDIVGRLEFPADSGYENYSRYSDGDFLEDWGRVTGYRCDPELASMIVGQSRDALAWLAGKGVAFDSPVVVDSHGKARHSRAGWHGGFVEAAGAGPGLTESLIAAVEKAGTPIHYGMHCKELKPLEGPGTGWEVRCQGRSGARTSLSVGAVVLASGGFQSDVEWRTRCLGPGWDLAKVRGSGYNTGDGLKAAFAVGAVPFGNWSGCHAVAWSVGSGDAGRRDANHLFERESYPFGITVNVLGCRFVDEGSDFGAYTYAKYGREILAQANQTAWQLFDSQAEDLLTSEYRVKNPEAARTVADTLPELARRLGQRGVDAKQMLATVEEYNAAVVGDRSYDPYVKDGRRTTGLAIDKTNWARGLIEPPFSAYEVTCGITFTFGGLRIDTGAAVLDQSGEPIPGVYACGEIVGGLHYFNYASGTGLTSGTVLGRIAGRGAGGGPRTRDGHDR